MFSKREFYVAAVEAGLGEITSACTATRRSCTTG